MGSFWIEVRDGGRVIREEILPNTLHAEGAELWWSRVFMGQSASCTFRMGIIGNTVHNNKYMRPDFVADPDVPPELTFDTTLTDLETGFGVHEGGGADSGHRTLLGYQRKTTHFAATRIGEGLFLTADTCQWTNARTWTPYSGRDTQTIPEWRELDWPYDPVLMGGQGFPWQIPGQTLRSDLRVWDPVEGHYRAVDPASWTRVQWMRANEFLGSAWPLKAAFVTIEAPQILTPFTTREHLLFSTRFQTDLILHPDQTLHLGYSGTLYQRDLCV